VVGETILTGSLLLAIPLSLAAGFLSFASPCVLPLVPGYLSYISGLSHAELMQSENSIANKSKLIAGTLGFIAGFSFLFVSYGLAFGQLGSWFLKNERIVSIVLGLFVMVLGAAFMGWIKAFEIDLRPRWNLKSGVWTAPLLGILFGLGWAPCVGPTLAAVQTLAFTEGNALRGALLSLFYCVGLGIPFLIIALMFKRSLQVTKFLRAHTRTITRIGGIMMFLIGLALVTGLWSEVTAWLRIWGSEFGVLL
jgi:cytochrome c-type biogenesis protein